MYLNYYLKIQKKNLIQYNEPSCEYATENQQRRRDEQLPQTTMCKRLYAMSNPSSFVHFDSVYCIEQAPDLDYLYVAPLCRDTHFSALYLVIFFFTFFSNEGRNFFFCYNCNLNLKQIEFNLFEVARLSCYDFISLSLRVFRKDFHLRHVFENDRKRWICRFIFFCWIHKYDNLRYWKKCRWICILWLSQCI